MITSIRIASMAIVLNLLFTVCNAQIKVGETQLKNGRQVYLYDDKSWDYADNTKASPQQSSTGTTSAPRTSNQHVSSSRTPASQTNYSPSYSSSTCGAPTKKGGACRRKTSGGRCWQHGG